MTSKSTRAQAGSSVLTINGGSSSIKFALYRRCNPPRRELQGKIDRIGLPGTSLTFHEPAGNQQETRGIAGRDHAAASQFLYEWLAARIGFASIGAVGHRIVNGGARYYEPQSITELLLDELRRISAYAPEHLPAEIAMIDLFSERVSDLPQIACFDTAFHRNMPRVARILPIPRRFQAKGVERYGFHGLSYTFLMEELARVAGAEAALGRVVLAHLGNGASLAAIRDGKSIDTSMGFTPAAGVPMSTRSGDLDPGLVSYFAQTENMTAQQFHSMINHESGLLGVSETSSDLRDLLRSEDADIRAAEAVAMFCYHVKKTIGAFAAALGGLDTLVFSGGIGENSPEIRLRICGGLDFLGIQFDEMLNAAGEPVISADTSRVKVRIIRTDEDVVIAKAVFRILDATETVRTTPRS
ncbi:MAG: acetate/propionate family kinase [Betaproteobacteria bacterium]|nr:acetate/propionate family kinase [Betaproteobacteria bacterium]